MPINDEGPSALEQLCRSSLQASIAKLCEVGTWPRPPAARKLRIGYDFYLDHLRNIQELTDFLEYLASDEKLNSIYLGQSSMSAWWVFYLVWEQLFLNVLRETEGTTLNNRVFKKWFQKFLKELYSDTALWKAIDTITGLNFRAKTLNLDDFTTLTSTPGYDLEALVGEQELDLLNFHGGSPGGYDRATIVTTVRVPKQQYAGSTRPYPHLLKNIERSLAAIDAIRLTKPGVPRLHCHIMVHLSDFPLCKPSAYCNSEGDFGMYEKEATVEESDLQNITNLWRELMETRYKDPIPARFRIDTMDVALERFSKSYRHQSWLEDLVDLTIALESLFQPSDSNQELRYRIAIRAAWLLGVDKKDTADSIKVYKRVKAMYDIRSSTVHGETPEEDTLGKWLQALSGMTYDKTEGYHQMVEPAVESARDIVRKALKACTKLSKLAGEGPRWPFPPTFDENIVIASQRRLWQKASGIMSK